MRNLRWFWTQLDAMRFAKKIGGKVFKFTKAEMESLGTKCQYYVRWEI